MDREIEVEEICLMNVSNREKCKLLNDFLLDCFNEMEAVDQNMQPEVFHNLSEAYQTGKNYLRKLEKHC